MFKPIQYPYWVTRPIVTGKFRVSFGTTWLPKSVNSTKVADGSDEQDNGKPKARADDYCNSIAKQCYTTTDCLYTKKGLP